MPKSKKRKAHKAVHLPGRATLFYAKKEEVEGFKADVLRFEFLIEETLPKGLCTDDDVQLIIDNLNLMALILSRPKSRAWLDEDAVSEAVPEILRGLEAITSLSKRMQKTGRAVCTGEEIQALRNVAPIAGEVLHRSLEECPMMTFKEFYVQKKLLCSPEPKRVRVNTRQFDALVRLPWVELGKRLGGKLDGWDSEI